MLWKIGKGRPRGASAIRYLGRLYITRYRKRGREYYTITIRPSSLLLDWLESHGYKDGDVLGIVPVEELNETIAELVRKYGGIVVFKIPYTENKE